MNKARYRLMKIGFCALALTLAGATASLFAQAPNYDVLIRGAKIVDGTGNPWFIGDIAIKDGKIADVGHLNGATAKRTIDGTGLVAAPGFIDLHTHSDLSLLADGTAQSKIRDGVTLDVIGEGASVAPRDGLPAVQNDDGTRQDWTTFTQYFSKVKQQGISINLASQVSANQVRRVVMGYDSQAATPAQIEQMKKLVARSMEEGALGLVAEFESGGPDHPDEIIDLAKVTHDYGGHYFSHIGSEGFDQEKELAFVIRLSEEAQIPAHIFHFKIRAVDNWGLMSKYIGEVQGARARGLDITANEYPYTAMSHGWSAFFPVWARAGGPAKFAERLNDEATREKIKHDPDFISWSKEHGGWDGIVMARAFKPENKKYEGKSVSEIAKMMGSSDPAAVCINLMADEGGRITGVFHTMSEENVRKVMQQPWVGFGSDGSAINLDAPGVPHPRNFSTHARVLGYYVRDQHVLTLEDAIRKSTSLPAQILGLTDRGQIHQGFAADVVLFDPAKVGETNSFEKPKSYSTGIPYVLVNGVVVIDKGEHTGARPGQIVYGHGYKHVSSQGAQGN